MSKGVHREHEHMTTYHSVYHSVKCINTHNPAMPLPLMAAPMAPIYDITRWNSPSLMTTLSKSNEELTISVAFINKGSL